MRCHILWLLTAVALLTAATRAAHVRDASSSSLASSYANDPRPDAVNEETSDILGTGGAYEFRLPQPQINKQQQQQQQQSHKTKRPNTTATYVTTTKTTSSSSSTSSGSSTSSSSGSNADDAGNQSSTKWSTTRPANFTTANSGNNKADDVSYPTTTPAQSTHQAGFAYNVSVTPQRPSYDTSTPHVANDEVAVTSSGENYGESSKKIIGSSVVTSVSVILNGNEPEFTDALGHKVPKPQPSLQVASPIDLLNPDRYEFYTFDENGELVKRLMTMEEIQSIVANGDGENSSIIQHLPIDAREPEKNVQDIVDSVQNVLNKEVESNKNISKDDLPVLDTPDVTSSWSMILPAIFGNGGSSDIFPQHKPQQIVMTPDSELLDTSTSSPTIAHSTKRPKPNKRKPGQKRKPTTQAPTTTTTAMTPQVVQEELGPHESVYTGMQEYQNVAANMQNFDGFSQLQMQPIYHKLPESTQLETTTRRVFVNNQEIIQSGTTVRPTVAEDKVELNESYGKRPPVVVHRRPVAPHRHKTPNGGDGSSTTKKPQGAHNKQKIKKKPTTTTTPEPITTSTTTTTTTAATITTPQPTTPTTTIPTTTTTPEPTTTTPEPTTTTPKPTTTAPEPITTTPEPTTTTTTPAPIITTPEPTTTTPAPITTTPEPIITTTTQKPSSTTPKKKRKKPTRHPGQGNGKPHPAGEKRKPATGKPRPNGVAQHNAQKPQQTSESHGNKHHPVADVSVTPTTPIEPTINKHDTTVGHKPNRTRPRPHKRPVHAITTSTTSTTSMPVPITPTMTTTTTPAPITTTTITINPIPSTTTTTENTLVVEHFPGYHPVHVKPSHANKRPGVSGYPVPVYKPVKHGVHEVTETVVTETDIADQGQLKRNPLPSLAQIQQQHNNKQAEKPILLDDVDTLSSFDQILESLKEELANKADTDINEPSASETRPSTDKPLDVDLNKKPAQLDSSINPSVYSIPVIQYSALDNKEKLEHKEEPLSVEKEDVATDEDAAANVLSFTTIQPPTLAVTSVEPTMEPATQPILDQTTEEQVEQEIGDTTNVSEYSIEENEHNESESAKVEILEKKETDTRGEDLSHVVKFEPLYADVHEPIVTELTTTAPNDEDDTTIADVIDEVSVQALYTGAASIGDSSTEYQLLPPNIQLPVTQKVEMIIAEDGSSTEPAPQVANLNSHLNMDVLKPMDQINMTDFQTQAATIASILVDGTNTLASDLLVSSNETRNEIDFLLSDVLHQMAAQETNADRPDPLEDGNRLTNFAQLNSSFLLKPTQSGVKPSIEGDSLPAYGGLPAASIVAPSSKEPESLIIPTTEAISEAGYELTTEIDYTTELLAYPASQEVQETDKAPESTENLEKEQKAELSLENAVNDQSSPQREDVALSSERQPDSSEKAEIDYTTEKDTEMADSFKLDEVEQKLSVQPNNPESEESTSAEYESTTVKEQQQESYSSQTDEPQLQEGGSSSEPLIESETTILEEQLSAKDNNGKKEMAIDTNLNKAPEKISESNNENEKIVEEEEQQEGLAASTDTFITHTNANSADAVTHVISTNEDIQDEEQSTVQVAKVPDSKIEDEHKLEAQIMQATETRKETQASTLKEEDKKHEGPQSESNENDLDVANKNGNEEAADFGSDKEMHEKDNTKNITNVANTWPEYTDGNYAGEKFSTEKEISDPDAASSPVLIDIIAEETHGFVSKPDSTEHNEKSAEKEAASDEEDNVTNAANLQLQYTKVPTTTEKYESDEEQEQSSEVIETEITTVSPTDESSTAVEENENESEEPEPTTDVTIMTSDEIDSTESTEDAYIKLGESTTKHTEELNKVELSANIVSVEEDSSSTDNAYLDVATSTLSQPVEQDIFKATTPAEKQSEAEFGEEEAEPQEVAEIIPPKAAETEPAIKVDAFTSKPTGEANKLETSELSDVTEQLPIRHTAKPVQAFLTQQHTQASHLGSEYRPDPQNAPDLGDQTSYVIPKFPTSPVLAALSTPVENAPHTSTTSSTTSTTPTTPNPTSTTTKRIHTLKPVSYYNKHSGISAPKPVEPVKISPYSANTAQPRPVQRPVQLNNLMATSTQATRPPVKMEPSPSNSKGLEASTRNLDEDLQSFVKLCNELAFSYWKSITSEKISSARSLVVSPFALTSMLSMVFLGARGSTSGEMNEVLKLDDMVTFNPHLVFRNITDSVERASDSDIATAAFVREIFSDRANGKILQFFKEKTQQFYAGHVEEVNFHVVNDVIRRRTNLLVKRHTMGKVLEYLRTNSLWVNGPLATISANLFQTDCRRGSTQLTDGEMFFQVHPSVRQRRLIPIPAVLYKSGFTAGYEPNLDATIVAFGSIQDTVSLVYVMPGHQSTLSPAESLERLERELVEQAFSKNAWSSMLTSLMDRPGMEVQLPRFSHRSFVNASLGLQKMGLKGLFKSDFADLRGLTGSSNRDIYLSDVIQINTFSTCGEEKIADHHHVEMYPAPPLRKRNKDLGANDDGAYDSSEAVIDFGSLVHDSALGRGFYDDLLDPKYLEMPLSLRPRQARVPDAPRLRFDKPFLYFVRHNPTGIILFMGRFNPRLLP